jgi:(2R)-ethylmalonyl-CoA mutase
MDESFLPIDPSVEMDQVRLLEDYRKRRDNDKALSALDRLRKALHKGENIMDASMDCSEYGVTTGEWSDALRDVFGEYRAPTGISGVTRGDTSREEVLSVNRKIKQLGEALGRNVKLLVGKPGLDGHSNGAEQVAIKARDVGMDVVYEGIRLTPAQIAESALQEGVHVVGLSILSGSHLELVPEVIHCMKERGLDNIPVVLGGIIPKADYEKMDQAVIQRVYAPKDYDLNKIMSEIADIVAEANQIDLTT